jgi:hypothetical protein
MRADVSEAVEAASVSAGLTDRQSILWRPIAVVEKFSDDQVKFVTRKLELPVAPSGDMLRALAGAPEDGIAADVGNLLVTAGLNRLTSLLIGAGGQAMTNTATRLGVGNSSSAEAVGQTDLQAAAGSGNRWFQVMDATYPQQSNGVVTVKATFATGDGNFVWNEWGIDIGTPTVSSGNTVAALFFNRKVASLGTKASGSWVLTVTVTIA